MMCGSRASSPRGAQRGLYDDHEPRLHRGPLGSAHPGSHVPRILYAVGSAAVGLAALPTETGTTHRPPVGPRRCDGVALDREALGGALVEVGEPSAASPSGDHGLRDYA